MKLADGRRGEIVTMRRAGASYAQIAQCLGVSEKTVQRTLRTAGLGAALSKLSPKQRRLVEGVAQGKSKRQAARDAGYSESRVQSGVVETAPMQRALRELLMEQTPPEHAAARIREGIDADRLELFAHQGRIVSREQHPDLGMRHRYLELYAKVTGAIKDAVDVHVPIQVVIDL